jgi:hypothetical protein
MLALVRLPLNILQQYIIPTDDWFHFDARDNTMVSLVCRWDEKVPYSQIKIASLSHAHSQSDCTRTALVQAIARSTPGHDREHVERSANENHPSSPDRAYAYHRWVLRRRKRYERRTLKGRDGAERLKKWRRPSLFPMATKVT